MQMNFLEGSHSPSVSASRPVLFSPPSPFCNSTSSNANSEHQYIQPGKKYGCGLHIVPSNEESAGGHVRVLSNRNGLVIEVEELPHKSLHRGVPLAAPAEITHLKKFNIQKMQEFRYYRSTHSYSATFSSSHSLE